MENKRKKIVILNHAYLPGYKSGGPIQTIAGMVEVLDQHFDIYVVTRDRDSGDTKPYENVEIDKWTKFGDTNVYYLSPKEINFFNLKRLLKESKCDVIYLNSFFNFRFTVIPLLISRIFLRKVKVVVAPRGEFSMGALSLKSKKKNLFISLVKAIGLYNKVKWHASSEHEKNQIADTFGNKKLNIHVAQNISKKKIVNVHNEISKLPIRIVFLARIVPMKNLLFALSVLKELDLDILFTIYGTKEDAPYWIECEKIIQQMPQNVKVVYEGEVVHNRVIEVLGTNHLLFLPTKGENYGHVIVEALTGGIPVLISDQTPWRNLEVEGVGWDLSLSDVNSFKEKIIEYADMIKQDKGFSRDFIANWIYKKANNPEIIDANIQLFLDNNAN